MSEVSCKQCGKLESNYLLSIILIPKAISFCSTPCLVNFIEHKNDHIPDIGKMVEPTTEESSEIECIDGGEIDIKKLNLATEKQCINLINHSLQKIKNKKLKPVDENCIGKRIIALDCAAADILHYTECFLHSIWQNKEFNNSKISYNCETLNGHTFIATKVQRIRDYDYGDGDNYE